jgi:hypothetical protein
MAASHLTFSADISDWVMQTKERIEAVAKESAQRVVERAQDYISGDLVKVQTGFLRASLRGSNTPGIPLIDNKTGQDVSYDGGTITLTINNWKMGEPLYLMYGANYAAAVHNGTWKMSPRPWVTLSAMAWPHIVEQVTEEAKARAGDR